MYILPGTKPKVTYYVTQNLQTLLDFVNSKKKKIGNHFIKSAIVISNYLQNVYLIQNQNRFYQIQMKW